MKPCNHKKQSGFALLIFVVVLMGMGGLLISGYTQGLLKEVEVKRFEHNTRVLKEAKQALLMFAYNYPVNNPGRGPGRLPCPDTNDSGTPNPSFNCISGAAIVGRFPWDDIEMNFYDARDSSHERLWYAVSRNFANTGPVTINSDTTGTITVIDQSQNIVYDGNGAGIAAVIIAPGAELAGQNRTGGSNDPANFLDSFNGFDNSVFTNGESDTNDDGFILGPVFDPVQNSYIINDQIIVITAAEVIEVAEKATLQAYQSAINDYRDNIKIDTPAFDAYPWLDDYTTTNLTKYDADVGTRLGRLPSIFGNYFATSSQPSQAIISDVDMELVGGLTVNGYAVPLLDPGVIDTGASIVFNAVGDLIITPAANGTSIVRYYWDEVAVPDGWEECLPAVMIGDERDCNQATANPGVPDSLIDPNELETRVVRVTYANNLVAAVPFTRPLTDSAGFAPTYQAPTATDHARIYFQYSETTIDAIGVDFKYDEFYRDNFDDFLLGSLDYELGVTYYPELPDWPVATEDDWHDSVQVAYSEGFEPGQVAACGGVNPDCITVSNISGIDNNKIAVLALASEHDLQPDDGAVGYQDDLGDIFDIENDDIDDEFDARAPNGNDKILVIR